MAPVVSAMPHTTLATPTIISSKPRRSTLVRKRDDDDMSIPSSPSKRTRVTFDSDVEVRSIAEFEKAPELIQEEVRSAFEGKVRGDRGGYERLKLVYTGQGNEDDDEDDDTNPSTLRNYLAALLRNIPSLNKTNRDLVHAIIHSQWLGRGEDYFTTFTRLLASIIIANASFLEPALLMLVNNLKSSPPSSGRLAGEPFIPRTQIFARVHKTLQYLTQLIPAASSKVVAVLKMLFPHSMDSVRGHTVFTKNLLKVSEYAPEMRTEILALITDRLVKIDVQVQVDIEDLEDDMDDILIPGLSISKSSLLEHSDGDSDTSDDDSDDDDDDNDPDLRKKKEIKSNVAKMDSLMDILFTYYDLHRSNLKSGIGFSTIIDHLTSQFDTIILPTHRSRHTQFLLFHYVQQSQADTDQFVGLCASKILDKKQSTMTRQNASAYLGSFVARGMKVPASIVRMVFDYISGELDRLKRESEPSCRGPDIGRYPVYYCLVQALLYMFCFRWRDLQIRSEDGEDDDDDLDVTYTQGNQWKVGVKEVFPAHVFSKLNPLKVCSPAIVNEFARVAKHLGVIYVYHLLETNKRIRLTNQSFGASVGMQYGQFHRDSALSVSQGESNLHLDAYFPFDPYHLPQSKRWIEDDYREWQPIPGLDDVDDESETEDENDINESDLEAGMDSDMTAISK